MEGPWSLRSLPVSLGVADVAAGTANYLRLAIAGQIHEPRRLVVEHIENFMPLPVSFTALGVFIPGGFFSRKPIDKDVGPAICIKVISKHQEAFGVRVVSPQSTFKTRNDFLGPVGFLSLEAGIGGSVLVALFEI